MDIGLHAGTKDEAYLDTLSQTLQLIERSLTPDLVLFDAGIDVYTDDGLGNLELSIEGIRKRDQLVLEHYRGKDIPIATVIGGATARIPKNSLTDMVLFLSQRSSIYSFPIFK